MGSIYAAHGLPELGTIEKELSAVSRQLQTREKTILSWLFNILGDCRVIRLRRIPRNGNQWWLCPLYITAYCLLAKIHHLI